MELNIQKQILRNQKLYHKSNSPWANKRLKHNNVAILFIYLYTGYKGNVT